MGPRTSAQIVDIIIRSLSSFAHGVYFMVLSQKLERGPQAALIMNNN